MSELFKKKEAVFIKDKNILQSTYIPEHIIARDKEIEILTKGIYNQLISNQKPDNKLIYGKTGTGKTVTINFLNNNFNKYLKDNNIDNIKIIYINCHGLNPQTLAITLLKTEKDTIKLGQSPIFYLQQFFDMISKKYDYTFLVLDEVENIIKRQDIILYQLSRAGELGYLNNSYLSTCCITNQHPSEFFGKMSDKTQSSFGRSMMEFKEYETEQLFQIIKERCSKALFRVPDDQIIKEIAISEHNIRKSLELLRKIATTCEEKGMLEIKDKTIVSEAVEKLKKENFFLFFTKLIHHHKILFYSIYDSYIINRKPPTTKDVMILYHFFCEKLKIEPKSEKRVYKILEDIDANFIRKIHVEGKNSFIPQIHLQKEDLNKLYDELYF